MAQEVYYNDIVAQLVELRNKIGEGGGSGEGGGTIDTSKLEAKLDEVIKAVKEIKVSTDSISVEAGTINLSTDELESILKETRDYIKNIVGTKNADDKSLYNLIHTINNALATITSRAIAVDDRLANIDTKMGDIINPADGTINKNIIEIKALEEYNADNNFKSSQALTLSTDGKGLADITNELGEYLKNVIGLKDEEIGTLYNLIDSIDTTALSIKSIVNVIKTLIQSSTNNISIIQGVIGNTINPNEGTILKLLNELKTLIAPNSDVTVETVVNKLKAIMTNDTAIANAQLTVGANQHNELLEAINSGTLVTYLQNIIGLKPDNGDSAYDLIDSINDATNNTVGRLSGRSFTPTSFNRYTIQDALIYLITAIGKGGTSDDPQDVNNTIIGRLKQLTEKLEGALLGQDGTPIANYTGETNTVLKEINKAIGKNSDYGMINTIHGKLSEIDKALRESQNSKGVGEVCDNIYYSINDVINDVSIFDIVKKALIADDDTLLVDKVSQIISNLQANNSSIGAPADTSNIAGTIHAKLRSFIELFINGITSVSTIIKEQTTNISKVINDNAGKLVPIDVPTIKVNLRVLNITPTDTEYIFFFDKRNNSNNMIEIFPIVAGTSTKTITNIKSIWDIYYSNNDAKNSIPIPYSIYINDTNSVPIPIYDGNYFPEEEFYNCIGHINVAALTEITITINRKSNKLPPLDVQTINKQTDTIIRALEKQTDTIVALTKSYDYVIKFVADIEQPGMFELRLSNVANTNNIPNDNITDNYKSIRPNERLYLNYADFESIFTVYFYMNGKNVAYAPYGKKFDVVNEGHIDVKSGQNTYTFKIQPITNSNIGSKEIIITLQPK